jgi:hypothetical protein
VAISVAKSMNYTGEIVFDTNKADGQYKKTEYYVFYFGDITQQSTMTNNTQVVVVVVEVGVGIHCVYLAVALRKRREGCLTIEVVDM